MSPVYNYLCKCGREEEVFYPTIGQGKKTVQCKDCGRNAKKTISQCDFRLKGGGWERDGYASKGSK